MINSAEEFIYLRDSQNIDDYSRATDDSADVNIWMDVINRYPAYKGWVVHNKTIPMSILEILSQDEDSNVREAVARKRKINDTLIKRLSKDANPNVRYSLMCNRTLTREQLLSILVEDDNWLTECLKERLQDIDNGL